MVERLTGLAARPNYPWLLIILLWMVAFLNAADRSILIAVMPNIRDDFDLSRTQLALLNSAFFWIYAVAAFFSGRMGDSMRRSRVIVFGLMFWSVATGLTSLATTFGMLLALRGLVALGEATYYPTATALIGDWHAPRWRSRALSLHQTGVFAGAGLGALAAGLLADHWNWHTPFLLFAIAGLAYALLLRLLVHDAPVVATTAVRSEPLRVIWKVRPALMLCAVFFLANGASTGVTVWAPTYVHDVLKLDLAGSALVGSATINIAGFLTVPVGGLLADWMIKYTPIGRFYTLALGLSLAAVLLLPLTAMKTGAAIGAVLIATSVGKGLFDGTIYAAMHDVVPPHARATAVGAMTMVGFFGAGLTPIFVAQTAEHFGMAAAMTSLTCLYVIAVVLILFMRSSIRRAVAANSSTH